MKCNLCNKDCDKYYNLNVIDEKEGSTNFMFNYDIKCWLAVVIDWAAQIIVDTPELREGFEEAIRIKQKEKEVNCE